MSDAAQVSIKNLLGLASVVIVSAILIGGTTGIFNDVNEATTVNWIDNNLKPAVMEQCAACWLCGGGGEDPNPEDGTLNQEIEGTDMYLERKGDSNNRLHLVTEDENGETVMSVRIAVSRSATLRPDTGCNFDKVSMTGNTEDGGLKRFKVRPNDRGAEIEVQ